MKKTWTYEELTANAELEIRYWRTQADAAQDNTELFGFLVAAGAIYNHWRGTCMGWTKPADSQRLAALAGVEQPQ